MNVRDVQRVYPIVVHGNTVGVIAVAMSLADAKAILRETFARRTQALTVATETADRVSYHVDDREDWTVTIGPCSFWPSEVPGPRLPGNEAA